MGERLLRAVKAAVLHAPGALRVEEVPIPQIKRGEVLVKVELSLTCGTDVKMYQRGHPYAHLPLIIGHEFVGSAEELGGDVEGVAKGDRVVAANSAPCGVCRHCLRGRENLCVRLDEEIIGFTSPGCYAEYVRVPARIVGRNLHLVPPTISPEEAAFLEPLACVVHGAELAGIGAGDRVVVLGGGPIGLLHVQVARLRGAVPIILVDRHREKLEAGRRVGADEVVDGSAEDTVQRTEALTGGEGADVVVEATGKVEAWSKAVQLVGKGGTVLFFGGCPPGSSVNIDTSLLHYGEVKLQGAFHHTPRSVATAWRIISSRRLKLRELVSGQVPLGRVEEAIRSVVEGRALKMAVRP